MIWKASRLLAALCLSGWSTVANSADIVVSDPAIQATYADSMQHLSEGRLSEAIISAELAYESATRTFAPDDLATAALGLNYATFLMATGSYRTARPILKKCHEVYLKHYADDAIEMVPVLVKLAQNDRKPELAQQALAIQRKAAPQDPLAYANMVVDMADLLQNREGSQEAVLEQLNSALKVLQDTHGPRAKQLVDVHMALGDTHANNDAPKRQRYHYDQALKILKPEYDADSADTSYPDLLLQAGSRIMGMSSSKRAGKYLEQAHEAYLAQLGPQAAPTATANFMLGTYAARLGKHKQALERLLSAREVFKSSADYRVHELKALGLIVQMYEDMGKRDEATQYCQAIGQIEPWTREQDPQPLVRTAPRYPRDALIRRAEGEVVMEFTIDKQGFVVDASVIESNGGKIFHEPALEAIRGFRFAPRFANGEPVATPTVQNKITFRLGS